MANPANETILYPFTAFNFSVEISVPGVSTQICAGAFQECDLPEMTLEVKTIREGGNNGKQIRLTGAASFGQVTLKRGVTANFDIWKWFRATLTDPGLRGEAEIVLLAPDAQTKRARFQLSRCLPVKVKAPSLNGKDGTIAIEELQLAFESVWLREAEET